MKKTIFTFLLCILMSFTVYGVNDINIESDEVASGLIGLDSGVVKPTEVEPIEEVIPENMKSAVLNAAPLSIVKKGVISTDETATDETATDVSSETLMLMQGDVPICAVESTEFKYLLNLMVKSVSTDAITGFNELKDLTVTQDYIKLKTWGEFFNKYSGRAITAYPIGSIAIKFDDYDFVIVSSEDSKKVISTVVLPAFYQELMEVSKNYPVKRYVLNIQNGSLLKDYVVDLDNVTEIKTVYPFENVEKNTVFVAGSSYGLNLDIAYVDILRGYLDGATEGYDRPVEGEYPGCVNVLSYVTLLKNVAGYTLEDKNISDFIIYENLAVCLDTKELINTTDMTTKNKALKYEDYKLNLENLLLTPINDDVVIVQPLYLECFYYKDLNKGLGRFVDVTPFISKGEHFFGIEGTELQLPMESFVSSDGYLETVLGQSPFLIYYNEYMPYDRIITWLNTTGRTVLDKSEVKSYMKSIKSEMYSEDRKSDYNLYLKNEGLMTDTTKMIIGIVVTLVLVGVIVGVVIILKKKSETATLISSNSSLLFEDTDDDSDDANESNFEIK